MDVDGNDQIYALKGPGGTALYGGAYGRLTERPTTLLDYRFGKQTAMFFILIILERQQIYLIQPWDIPRIQMEIFQGC